MKKKLFFAVILATVLFSLTTLSPQSVQFLRVSIAEKLAPIWEGLVNTHLFMNSLFSTSEHLSAPTDHVKTKDEEMKRLRLEQQLLLNEVQRLQELYTQLIESPTPAPAGWMDLQVQALPARVIYRSPGKWNHSLWINVGNADNHNLPVPVVAVNSPVLLGTSVVGVIEHVSAHQSRVRLITDPALAVSVRSVRGSLQNKWLNEHLEFVLDAIQSRQDPSMLVDDLYRLKNQLQKQSGTWYLAKGEMRGSVKSAGRGSHTLLKGVGFNYDYADEKGPARDLRTGKPKDRDSKIATIPILKVNDLLVTTGMDGIFPSELRVGIVTSIQPLKEGDFYYELEVKPAAGDLDDLSLVFVIPPTGYKQEN